MLSYLNLPITISFDEDIYIAECLHIQGAYAEGETPELAQENLKEVIHMIYELDQNNHKGDFRQSFEVNSNKISSNFAFFLPSHA